MQIEIIDKKLQDISANCEIIVVIDENLEHRFIKDKKLLEKLNFEAKQDAVCFLPESSRLYVGSKNLENESIRRAMGAAIMALSSYGFKTLKTSLYISQDVEHSTRAIAEGFLLGSYKFDDYKSKKSKSNIERIYISTESYNKSIQFKTSSLVSAIQTAKVIAKATNTVRDIVNTTPHDFTPKSMAKRAYKLSQKYGLEYNVLNVNALKEEKMEAMLAVGRASIHKPLLVHLAHKPKNPVATISLVGKGLTYDSGGLSLKPSDFMVTMKLDKSGASAVFGIMQAVVALNLPIEVHGFLAMAENMVAGNAFKPDDVLTAKNGTTIEVRNTDAEGRLVLADALCYAQQEVKSDYIFDFATLTGACVVALGHYTSGLMGHSSALKHSLFQAANNSGELVGTLPFNDHLQKLIKSEIADVCNIGSSRYGGAITAAMFLDKFIEKKNKDKWMHIDIAGPAYVEEQWAYNPFGASGAGVRLMLSWMEDLIIKTKKENNGS